MMPTFGRTLLRVRCRARDAHPNKEHPFEAERRVCSTVVLWSNDHLVFGAGSSGAHLEVPAQPEEEIIMSQHHGFCAEVVST